MIAEMIPKFETYFFESVKEILPFFPLNLSNKNLGQI
jgi:hypothetical protein